MEADIQSLKMENNHVHLHLTHTCKELELSKILRLISYIYLIGKLVFHNY